MIHVSIDGASEVKHFLSFPTPHHLGALCGESTYLSPASLHSLALFFSISSRNKLHVAYASTLIKSTEPLGLDSLVGLGRAPDLSSRLVMAAKSA